MGDTLKLQPLNSAAPSLPAFKPGERVNFYPAVTGGIIPARVVRSRYSAFYECWVYDIQSTTDNSALYPKAHIQHGVSESCVGRRL